MRLFKILWTKTAEKDLEAIADFIALERPQTALKILRIIRLKASFLQKNPGRGRLLPELVHLKGLAFREIVINPWRLVYRIHKNRVQILSIFDGRRDLEDILYERLTQTEFS